MTDANPPARTFRDQTKCTAKNLPDAGPCSQGVACFGFRVAPDGPAYFTCRAHRTIGQAYVARLRQKTNPPTAAKRPESALDQGALL